MGLLKRRVIIDTDPGVDDMFAILSALGAGGLDVMAVTTVGGNTGLGLTTRNALRILAAAGRAEVPVYAGADGPLEGATHVHGDDGILGTPLPEPVSAAMGEHAADYLCRVLMEEEAGTIDVACLGPLTNLALALEREPGIAARVRSVVVMGGGFGTYALPGRWGAVGSRGNVTAEAEFNIYSDPEAAARVAAAVERLVVIPLDVSHQTLVRAEWLARLAELPRWGGALARTLDAYGEYSRSRWGTDGGPLHDPNVLVYLEEEGLYRTVEGRVEVECGEGSRRGATRLAAGGPHRVAVGVDAEAFLERVFQNLARVLG
jgi:purine nucleosidase